MEMIKTSYCLLLVASLFVQIGYADEETDTIYMYKNDNGVPEFTDEVKPNQQPDAQRELQNMTPEQEAASKAKLDQIVADDKELDARVAEQNKLDSERNAQRQQAKQEKQDNQKQDVTEDESYYYNNRNVYNNPNRPISRPINRPARPIARPR